jgi:hypothetical protein
MSQFLDCLKKNNPELWDDDYQQAFDKINKYL